MFSNVNYIKISGQSNKHHKKSFESDEPCAIWLFPYRNIDLTKLLIKRKRSNNKNFDPDKPEKPEGKIDLHSK